MLTGLVGCAGSDAADEAEVKAADNEEPVVGAESEEVETEESEHITIRLADQAVNLVLYFNYAKDKGILDEYFDGYDVDFEVSDFASGVSLNLHLCAICTRAFSIHNSQLIMHNCGVCFSADRSK